jgi:glycosyltransferase involved in cell wall biosynthesis
MLLRNAKIAIVCDWLTVNGGAEKVIRAFHEIFPLAPIYTSLYDGKKVPGFEKAKIMTSYLQKIPLAISHHQHLLPFMPSVFESMNLDAYDIVISSSHSCAKGIITKPDTLHICYCHTPMRYAWDNHGEYFKQYSMLSLIKKIGLRLMHDIRMWDRLAAERADHYCTNSQFVRKRIRKYYRKEADVIHPGVDMKRFRIERGEKNYYLAIGRLTPYKQFKTIIEAFNVLGKSLMVVGTGVQEKELKKIAKSNIMFAGYVPDEELPKVYAQAKALIFPQVEDFGITSLESMASGRPVIAYRGGGAMESMRENVTGIFFEEQTAAGIVQAVRDFEEKYGNFSSEEIRKHAEKFSTERFKEKFIDHVSALWQEHQKKLEIS